MELMQHAAAIGLVFGLLALALWALRRRGLIPASRGRRAARRLEPIERLALSPRHTLHLVRVADRVLLIGVHPEGCTLLESLPPGAVERGLEAS